MPSSPLAKPSKPRRHATAMQRATRLRMSFDGSSNRCWRKAKPGGALGKLQLDTMMPILASLHWSAIGLRVGVIVGELLIWFWTQWLIGRKAGTKEGIG